MDVLQKIGLPLLAGSILLGTGVDAIAQSGERWSADEMEARATLPAAGNVVASLSCEAQRWTMTFPVAADADVDDGLAILTVDGRPFELSAVLEDANVSLRIPREALEPLKNGSRMELTFSGTLETAVGALAFPLRGSKLAISAVEERCTRRDMSAYRPITFTSFSSYQNLARSLREDDIKAFETATASRPQLSLAMTEFGEGRRLLFTRLCGSSWYYGLSGCNITGFAPQADRVAEGDTEETGWRTVYDTENVSLYLDPASQSHGWPDLVTLPARGSGSGLVWRWDGRGYDLKGELPQDNEEAAPLGLRPTQE